MSSFSSVVRKPGQKIVPKTAPRRNVRRPSDRPAAPPSLTPESHAASPGLEPVGDHPSGQEDAQVSTILESTELPNDAESVDASLPVPAPAEAISTPTPDPPTVNRTLVSVEIYAPIRTSESLTIIHPSTANAVRPRSDAIPTVATTTSTKPRRRDTNEPTPAPSEESNRETEAEEEVTERIASSPSRKRRKITHTDQISPATQPSPTPPLSEGAALILRRSSRSGRSESRTSDALLQDATSQAAAVSELANSIENRVRSLGSRSARPNHAASDDETPEPTKQSRKKRRAKTIEEAARQVVQDAVKGGRRHSRLSTPENAEELQIDPEEVSMGALTRDTKLGRKSETEKKMQENWAEIQQRRKEEVARRREAAGQGRHGRQALGGLDPPAEEIHAPQQIIVNGQIVVAAESREVAFGAGVEQAVIEDADVALEDDRIYKYVNQSTVGKHAGLRRGTRWDEEKTELFYRGLRWFGTDFSMIANLFPQFDRRQVKLKFTIEMREDPRRVGECVAAKEPVDIEEYMGMTEQEFIDPEALQAELDAEEKRLRNEDEQRREREGYIRDPADIAIPSTERDENDEEAAEPVEDESDVQHPQNAAANTRRDRISAIAEQVVNTAVGPKKRTAQQQQQQQQRKTRDSVSVRGRQRKKSRMPMEGVEERIGPIDEVG
jgi:transcription factor TFIIIB component B''